MNNPNETFNNMYNPGAVPETKDSGANNLNPVSPNQLAGGSNVNSNALVNSQMNFSMPSTNDSASNNSSISGNGASVGGFSFVNPSVTGVVNENANSNLNVGMNNTPDSNLGNNGNLNSDNTLNNNVINSNNNSAGILGFELNSTTPNNNANPSLINTGITLTDANNKLFNNQTQTPVNNNLINGNVSNDLVSSRSNDLVSSGLPNTGVSPVASGYESITNNVDITPVKSYLLNMLLFCIPLVGFIMLIVKAIDKKESNIRNFARAYLLLSLIVGVIGFGLSLVALAPLLALVNV